MENQPPGGQGDGLVIALKRLTLAVWCLCAFLGVWIGFSIWTFFSPTTLLSSSDYLSSDYATRVTSGEIVRGAGLAGFHELPTDEKIRRSSVVLIVEHRKQGQKIAAVVTEILKKNPGTELYYAVGDEYETMSFLQRSDEMYGDGQVAFLSGSPATMQSSYSYQKDRIGGLGAMPLATFRELVTQLSSETSK